MIRPPGFAPLFDAKAKRIVDSSNEEESEYRITTKWPTQIIGSVEEEEIKFGESLEIRMVTGKSLVNINPGKGQIEEEEGFGFAFCKKCGKLEPR